MRNNGLLFMLHVKKVIFQLFNILLKKVLILKQKIITKKLLFMSHVKMVIFKLFNISLKKVLILKQKIKIKTLLFIKNLTFKSHKQLKETINTIHFLNSLTLPIKENGVLLLHILFHSLISVVYMGHWSVSNIFC